MLNCWQERAADSARVKALKAAGFPRLRARLLALRGIAPGDVEGFLHPQLKDMLPADSLPGVAEAADVILKALYAGERIVVFGDYDCDGVSATAILVRTLRELRPEDPDRIRWFLPRRLTEGYGMTERSVGRMLAEIPDVKLVVTVDNGINSIDEVRSLRERGVDVIVTDHHLPTMRETASGPEMVLPEARAVVNPKVASPAELDGLCGAGVAIFLSCRIVNEARRRGLYAGKRIGHPMVVLAGLATVTDVTPLQRQNRILVSGALALFDVAAPAGLRALLRSAKKTGAHNYRDFGFFIGPRINAAGRMATAESALRLMLAPDEASAAEFVEAVEGYNLERKEVERRMTDEARAQVVPGASAQVIVLPEGHTGVAGIVAARVLESLERAAPVCVIVGDHGSARAPEGVNVRDALSAAAETLDRFGGHAAAGGFSVKRGRMDDFRRLFLAHCDALPPTTAPAQVFDAWMEPEEVTVEFVEFLRQLEPFGEGNPEPRFAMRGVVIAELRRLGPDGRHLSVTFASPHDSRRRLRGVWWGRGEFSETLRGDMRELHDVLFTLTLSEYGERHVELRIGDVRLSAAADW